MLFHIVGVGNCESWEALCFKFHEVLTGELVPLDNPYYTGSVQSISENRQNKTYTKTAILKFFGWKTWIGSSMSHQVPLMERPG